MNNINITTELCAEDRARIDRLTAALEGLTAGVATVGTPYKVYKDNKVNNVCNVAEAPREDTEAPAEPETTPEEVGAPDDEPEVLEVPEHTKAELQQKVLSLVTAGKRDETRAIVKQYAERASAIPEEKINEVWDKLTALEG